MFEKRRLITTKKNSHICCECGKIIREGNYYLMIYGKDSEIGHYDSRTCLSCAEFRNFVTTVLGVDLDVGELWNSEKYNVLERINVKSYDEVLEEYQENLSLVFNKE